MMPFHRLERKRVEFSDFAGFGHPRLNLHRKALQRPIQKLEAVAQVKNRMEGGTAGPAIQVKGFTMRRLVPGILAVGLGIVSSHAHADWPWKHKSSVDAARNNSWPQPFRAADANSVVAPFEVMRNNGWRECNTLGSAVFTKENVLSEAGNLKIEQILTHAPSSQQIIYVKSSIRKEETDARVESTQLAVSKLVPVGPLPQILVTHIEPNTSSGVYQTTVQRALITTTPTPRLGAFSGVNAPSTPTVAPNANQAGTASSSGTNR
jgi:hypothetical protein